MVLQFWRDRRLSFDGASFRFQHNNLVLQWFRRNSISLPEILCVCLGIRLMSKATMVVGGGWNSCPPSKTINSDILSGWLHKPEWCSRCSMRPQWQWFIEYFKYLSANRPIDLEDTLVVLDMLHASCVCVAVWAVWFVCCVCVRGEWRQTKRNQRIGRGSRYHYSSVNPKMMAIEARLIDKHHSANPTNVI